MYKCVNDLIWSKRVKKSFFKLTILFPERSSSSNTSSPRNQSTETLTNRFRDMSIVFSCRPELEKTSDGSESPKDMDDMDNVRSVLNGCNMLWTLRSGWTKSLFSSAFNEMSDVLIEAKTASSNNLNLFLDMSSVLIADPQNAHGCKATISFLDSARMSSFRPWKVPSKMVVILFPSKSRIRSLGKNLNSSLEKYAKWFSFKSNSCNKIRSK